MISEFCIRRPVFTTLLMIAILMGGIIGYNSLSVSALPNVDFPTIQVSANLTGANPETMATSVATVLERQFSTIAGITSMISTSYQESSQITLQFDLNRNIDSAALDVQTAISTAIKKLPSTMTTPPSFQKVNPAEQPVYYIVVSSDSLSLSAINDYANTLISSKISTLPDVAQVSIYGSQKYALRIQVDPRQLANLGIGFNDLAQIASNETSLTPLGIISGEKRLFNLNIDTQPQQAKDFQNLIAIWKDGAPVKFSDIATLKDSVEDERSAAFLGETQSLIIAIQRQPNSNTVELVDNVKQLLPALEAQLPKSIKLTPMFDRSASIKNSIHDVQTTLCITIALVISVIYLFLGSWRITLIPAVAVPLSLIATYGGMALFGFSMNNISLLAITLSVGFVVDDAIVMMENIIRYIEKGMKPLDAAIKGAKEIGFTVISITISLVVVFTPVLLMQGIIGRLFREFAVTISFAIIVSAFVSLTLTPLLCSRIRNDMKPTNENKLFNKVTDFYAYTLQRVLEHQKTTLLVTVLLLFASVIVFMKAPKSFFPIEDTGFGFVTTEARPDISFDEMLTKQKEVAKTISQNPHIDKVFHSIGGGKGALNSGRVLFSLKPFGTRPDIQIVISELKSALGKTIGINSYIQPIQNMQLGGGISKSMYQYLLQSTNSKDLYSGVGKLLGNLSKQPGFTDVTSDLQLTGLNANILLDHDIAAANGITFNDIRQALYYAFGTAQVGSIYTSVDDYSVILEVAPQFRQNIEDIKHIYIKNSAGKLISLDTLIDVKEGNAPLSVNHLGQLPAVTISFNLESGYSLGDAVAKIKQAESEVGLPATVTGVFQGNTKIFEDSMKGQGMLLLLTVATVYIILGMLYESFIHPITILSGLPSAALGAILTLLLFRMDVSIIALIGIILLIGIVKKNSIMIVDFTIEKRKEGLSPQEAVYQACLIRFRPIMMTTMAAFFGSLPIAIKFGVGAEFRQPLGIAVTGGLLTSQLLTLYITPVVYLFFEKLANRHSDNKMIDKGL